uniref:Membrane protein n=1 Tax=Thermosporothrix sp. COM3 TaxID=2490863 RepID=A0A455SZD5_9CHLR|nr:membrane protein [Thermosporothrix sp. COM3]
MLYLSQLLGKTVETAQETRAGRIIDVLVPIAQIGHNQASYPSALVLEDDNEQQWRVLPTTLEWDQAGELRLALPLEQREDATTSSQDEISLAQEVFDKQVIDIKRKKAVRVNDVVFDSDWQILGIDASTFGLVRRLVPGWLLGSKSQSTPTQFIPWNQIEIIGLQRPGNQDIEETTLEPTPPTHPGLSGHLAELHPADIAEIVHQLSPGQGARIIEKLDNETAADTMEEIDTERQQAILENLDEHRAAEILQAMGPDEVADLLAQIPEERAQELLHLMKPEDSEEVQELLEYAANTAGGLMTTDYVALKQTHTVADALQAIRTNLHQYDIHSPYVYCLAEESEEEETHLVGVIDIWKLIDAAPTQELQQLMHTDLITVSPETEAQEVAETIAKYNLLAVPVVNEQGILEGIVTVDDALDVLLPPNKRRRPPKMY